MAFVAVGCHDARSDQTDSGGHADDHRDDGLEGGITDGEAPNPEASTAPIEVRDVRGRLVDESGNPIGAGVLVTACGPQQCTPGRTDDRGRFTVSVNLEVDPRDYSILAHGRPEYAAFYHSLPEAFLGPDVDVGDLFLPTLPDSGPRIEVDRMGAPAQTVTSGDVSMLVPEGTFVRLDVESATFGDTGREFRALRVSGDQKDALVDPSLGLSVLYGLEPFEARFETVPDRLPAEVRLSFENTIGLDAGASVEVFALGTYVYPDWVKPARFEPVARATVSADGVRIEMDDSTGLPYLTWVGLREAW